MGTEFKNKKPLFRFEEERNEQMLQRLIGMENQHKEGFQKGIDSLRKYYKDYIEETDIKSKSGNALYNKVLDFRSTPANSRETEGSEEVGGNSGAVQQSVRWDQASKNKKICRNGRRRKGN